MTEDAKVTGWIISILRLVPVPFLIVAIIGNSPTYTFYTVLRYVVFIVCLANLLV